MSTRMVCVGVGLALAMAVGCGSSGTPSAPPKEPIKIGAVFAVTGPAAFLGTPERNTAEMIQKQINAAGGIGGKGEGRPIEVVIIDTEGNTSKAVRAVQDLIGQGVVAIIGPTTSGESMGVLAPATEEEVPLVSCAAAETIVTPIEQRKWIFKTPQKDSDAVRRIYDHMKAKGLTKVAIITATTGFGKGGVANLKALAPEYGISIVNEETYDPAAIDMTAQLTKIRGGEAQAVVNWSIEPAQSIVPKNMKQLDIKIPLYQSHGFGNIKYAEAAGEAAVGLIFPAGRVLIADTLPDNHPQKKLLTDYRKAYEETYKTDVSTFGGHAYDALWMVVKAIEMNGPTRAGVRDALETMDFVGTAGHFKLSAADHNGLGKDAFEMLTVEMKDGKPRFAPLKD
jgi:branched-chain amino acid transport system substrate-binding protein